MTISGEIWMVDYSVGDEPVALRLEDFHMHGQQLLLLAKDASATRRSPVTISFRLDQPHPIPPALFTADMQVGPLGDGKNDLHGFVDFAGIDLSTLGPLVPSVSDEVLGGRACDMGAVIYVSPEMLFITGSMVSNKGTSFPIEGRGTPQEPKLSLGPLLAGMVGRLGSGMLGGAWDIGSGVAEVGFNIVGGVLDSALGVVTLDLDRIGSGMSQATIDHFKTDEQHDATGDALAEFDADDEFKQWLRAIPERHQERLEALADDHEAQRRKHGIDEPTDPEAP